MVQLDGERGRGEGLSARSGFELTFATASNESLSQKGHFLNFVAHFVLHFVEMPGFLSASTKDLDKVCDKVFVLGQASN